MSASAVPSGDKPHAVCLPFPAQGHTTPLMKLAKILHTRGFRATFINTEYSHHRLIRSSPTSTSPPSHGQRWHHPVQRHALLLISIVSQLTN
jgi:hypothetical protein